MRLPIPLIIYTGFLIEYTFHTSVFFYSYTVAALEDMLLFAQRLPPESAIRRSFRVWCPQARLHKGLIS
jgi:hypothetical protein